MIKEEGFGKVDVESSTRNTWTIYYCRKTADSSIWRTSTINYCCRWTLDTGAKNKSKLLGCIHVSLSFSILFWHEFNLMMLTLSESFSHNKGLQLLGDGRIAVSITNLSPKINSLQIKFHFRYYILNIQPYFIWTCSKNPAVFWPNVANQDSDMYHFGGQHCA